MEPKESEMLIAELKAWADEKYGRRSELARMLGLSPQLVSDWFAGRKTPTLDTGLKLQRFLKKWRKAKSRVPRS
jgi:transcriptional regulator with XRE-family HTH domain